MRRRAHGQPRQHQSLLVAFVVLIVLVCLFWTASNYAEVLGRQLAATFPTMVSTLPRVAVYSETRLHLTGPGVQEQDLSDDEQTTYRYHGLRLLEHTGGNYFLVSDEWSEQYGVVFVLNSDDDSLRYEFIRDTR